MAGPVRPDQEVLAISPGGSGVFQGLSWPTLVGRLRYGPGRPIFLRVTGRSPARPGPAFFFFSPARRGPSIFRFFWARFVAFAATPMNHGLYIGRPVISMGRPVDLKGQGAC